MELRLTTEEVKEMIRNQLADEYSILNIDDIRFVPDAWAARPCISHIEITLSPREMRK